MPFKSQAQRRKFAQLLVEGRISPDTYEEWNRETGGRALPERAGQGTKGTKGTKAKNTKGTKAKGTKRTKAKGTKRTKAKNTKGATARAPRKKATSRKRSAAR
jgi:hypothetical protein